MKSERPLCNLTFRTSVGLAIALDTTPEKYQYIEGYSTADKMEKKVYCQIKYLIVHYKKLFDTSC